MPKASWSPPGFNYGSYMASREWALLKEQVRARSGGICEWCKSAKATETHHETYERTGHELLTDLLHVCRPCHLWKSGKSDYNPAQAERPHDHAWIKNGTSVHCVFPGCEEAYPYRQDPDREAEMAVIRSRLDALSKAHGGQPSDAHLREHRDLSRRLWQLQLEAVNGA